MHMEKIKIRKDWMINSYQEENRKFSTNENMIW